MRNRKISWKWLPMIFVIVFSISFIFFDAMEIINYSVLADLAETYNITIGIIILVLLLSDIITPVPSSILMFLAGNIYGFTLGFLIGFAGSMGASFVGFYIMRKLKKPVGDKLIGSEELEKMNTWFKKWGEIGIVISRMVPMAAETMAFLAGLSKMKLKRFLILSVFGTLPITVYYAYVGSTAKNSTEWAVYITAGFFIPVLAWIIFKRYSQSNLKI